MEIWDGIFISFSVDPTLHIFGTSHLSDAQGFKKGRQHGKYKISSGRKPIVQL